MTSTYERIRRSIAKSNGNVVLRQQFMHFGSSSRVDAALRDLVQAGKLLRIGQGVYAKTKILQDGTPVAKESFWQLAIEALEKLGVDYDLHPVIADYQLGKSDQIPIRFTVIPKQRVSRKLSVGAHNLHYVSNSTLASSANRKT